VLVVHETAQDDLAKQQCQLQEDIGCAAAASAAMHLDFCHKLVLKEAVYLSLIQAACPGPRNAYLQQIAARIEEENMRQATAEASARLEIGDQIPDRLACPASGQDTGTILLLPAHPGLRSCRRLQSSASCGCRHAAAEGGGIWEWAQSKVEERGGERILY